MKKIIIIGECTLDLIFPENTDRCPAEVTARPGGRLLNAAAMLGGAGRNVTYVSECARDRIGDMLVGYLERHGVNTASIDRYTEGITSMNCRFEQVEDMVCSRQFPKERFDVVWPRIDKDDIVVFGTYFSLDQRVRPQLTDLLQHAVERKAILVYVPGLTPPPKAGVTKMMPDILENLEIANVVLTRSSDLGVIFKESDSARAYERHIRFYCDSYINVDFSGQNVELYHRDTVLKERCAGVEDTLQANAGAVAGAIAALADNNLEIDTLATLTPEVAAAIASTVAAGISAADNDK